MKLKLGKPFRLLVAGALLAGLVGCDNGLPVVTPTPEPTATPLVVSSPTPQPTQTPLPTATPRPTTIVQATVPVPTDTAQVAPATPTALPSATAVAGGGCVATGSGADPTGLGDVLYPDLGNAGYDALHYTLDVTVDVQKNTITGTVAMRAKALQDLDTFNLDLQGLNVSNITIDGAAATYDHSGHELVITPGSPLRQGQVFTSTVAYGGVPHSPDSGQLIPPPGWIHTDDGVYVASEPAGAATWFPTNDHPCDKATYTINVTTPKPYVVASNGLLQRTTDNGSSRTYRWESAKPMASYLVTIDITRFDVQEATSPEGLPLRYYFPHTLDKATRDYFSQTPDMITYFSSLFGPFPFESYGAIVADTSLGFALETQTRALFSRDLASSRLGAGEVISHELAHQWFGDSVSLKQWKDIWLNEGFATYAEWLWVDHAQGHAEFNSRIQDAYHNMQGQWSTLDPPGSPPADDLFNPSVYIRGGLTLHALRLLLGDDTFFRTLRTYADKYRYSNATTADFEAVAEQVSGQDLSDFFHSWLYEPTMPPLP